MKKIGFIAFAALALVACQPKNAYTIVGTADGVSDGDSVALQVYDGRNAIDVQKVPVEDGRFTIKGTANNIQLAVVHVGKSAGNLFLEPGTILVALTQGKVSYASGTLNNDLFATYSQNVASLEQDYVAVREALGQEGLTEEKRAELQAESNLFEERYFALLKASIADNTDNNFGLFNLCNNYYVFEAEQLDTLIQQYLVNFPNDEALQRINAGNQNALKTSVGKKFLNFSMTDIDGNVQELATYVAQNKVTLVDFWASWCGPCRAELPTVKAAYEAYKDKGFGIVGVSLDNNDEAWKKAVKDFGLTWPQLSDLKGWSSEGARTYSISSIPSTVLIAQDGTILAKDLRGEDIQKKLAELLKD